MDLDRLKVVIDQLTLLGEISAKTRYYTHEIAVIIEEYERTKEKVKKVSIFTEVNQCSEEKDEERNRSAKGEDRDYPKRGR